METITASAAVYLSVTMMKSTPVLCWMTIGTLRYEDGKARTATAVDVGNSHESHHVTKDKMLKMCISI
jgi:hypothetical protein